MADLGKALRGPIREKRRQETALFDQISQLLKVLLDAREKYPSVGGASGKTLMNTLRIESILEIRAALKYPLGEKLIEMGEREGWEAPIYQNHGQLLSQR